MTIILQNTGSCAFVEDLNGAWTHDQKCAHEFAYGLDALLFCFDRRLDHMQMLARFPDARMNFSVPVADARTE